MNYLVFTAFVNTFKQQKKKKNKPLQEAIQTLSTEIFEAVVFHFLLPTKGVLLTLC